jgi:hypothetical protein
LREILSQRVEKLMKDPSQIQTLRLCLWYKQRFDHQFARVARYMGGTVRRDDRRELPRLPKGFSPRKLRAFANLVPVFKAWLAFSRVNVRAREIRRDLFSLFTAKPGPEPDALTRKIRKVDDRHRAADQYLTDGQIARKVFPRYGDWNGHKRKEARDMVHERRLPA